MWSGSSRRAGVAVLAALLLGLPGASAGAHTIDPGALHGSDLHDFEAEVLGEQHADEHAALRRAEHRAKARYAAMSPAERRAARREQRARTRRIVASTADLPARRYGAWTEAPFEIPNYAIHSALLPTGKVLFWGYPPIGENGKRPNRGVATLWDPALGTGRNAYESVPPPLGDPDGDGEQGIVPLPIYCSGQNLLADGSLLLTGGSVVFPSSSNTDAYTNWAGLDTALTFDPFTESWTRQPDMDVGRWYPTQTLLADGSTMVIGGYDETTPGGNLTERAELFQPPSAGSATGSFSDLPDYTANIFLKGTLYPHAFVLPNGDVNVNGPYPEDTATLDLSRGTSRARWVDNPNLSRKRQGGNAVLMPSGVFGSWRIMEIGGYGYDKDANGEFDNRAQATATTEQFDARRPAEGWRRTSPQNIARSYANTVMLPDSSLVTVGGGSGLSPEYGNYETDDAGARHRVELYDPDTRTWSLGPAQVEDRTYHSTALLLPDGRVWSAGDDFRPLRADGSPADSDTGEIYSPPYLFRGARPQIDNFPRSPIAPDSTFNVRVSRDASEAVLVAPGATTHAVDMSQRVVRLRVEKRGRDAMRLRAPVSNGVAPPGYYMLFVLNDRGVPSIARWVQIDARD